MARAPLKRCSKPGCNVLVRGASRCERHRKERGERHDKQRPTANGRGYNYAWQKLSRSYRQRHPLCVPCLFAERVRPAVLVDHIVPIHSVPSLRMRESNLCSSCTACHSRKTAAEPRGSWEPDSTRIVLCGLPGVGKTHKARERSVPYFDADEFGLAGLEEIQNARARWIRQHRTGPITVIAAMPLAASKTAEAIGGVVEHVTVDENTRAMRLKARGEGRILVVERL